MPESQRNSAAKLDTVRGTVRQAYLAMQSELSEMNVGAESPRVEDFIRGLAETVPQMVWASDSGGKKTYCNQRYLQYTGARDLEEMDRLWATYIHPDDRSSVQKAWQRSLSSGEPYECQYRLRRSDGAYREILAQAIAARDGGGRIVSWIGSSTDIHEQKQVESAMRKAEKLAIAGRLAANIAHELNNPLASVTNAVYLAMKDETMSDEARTYLKLADNELRRIARVTQQALRFHRQSAGPVLSDLCALVDSVIDAAVPAQDTRIRIDRQYRECGELFCYADDIRQALASVIGNSLDAMPGGGKLVVRIRRSHRHDHQESGIRVTIADSGTGIPSWLRRDVTEPFVTTKTTTGTGLGLWVTKSVMDRHHGQLRIRSSTGTRRRGTTVTLFFPSAGVPEN